MIGGQLNLPQAAIPPELMAAAIGEQYKSNKPSVIRVQLRTSKLMAWNIPSSWRML